jgi:hypothetical protein
MIPSFHATRQAGAIPCAVELPVVARGAVAGTVGVASVSAAMRTWMSFISSRESNQPHFALLLVGVVALTQ